ncbi:MAG: hypothetical protein KAX24_08770, partial [Anaerolineae bacterium]|nr:hypothetical protein [Anaerolineae bacterium]
YVWPPGYQVGDDRWYSIGGPGEIDEVQFEAPEAGNYQIEVQGVTGAEYDITVEVGTNLFGKRSGQGGAFPV